MLRLIDPHLPPTEAVETYFEAARRRRWYSNFGPCHAELVERLEVMLGGRRCVPVANCTLGLMLMIRAAAGVPEGAARREIVIPSFTFVATAAAVAWAGFDPVFADVDPDSWHLAVPSLTRILADRPGRVAAVLACSTFGVAPSQRELEAWEDACSEAGVPLLVDSAAGFGSRDDRGRLLGSQGLAEAFSWHATKPFAVGEGGLVTTRDPDVARTLLRLSNFGLEGNAVSGAVGLNAKLDEWRCATALAQLDRFEELLAHRRAAGAAVTTALERIGLVAQRGSDAGTWQTVPLLAPTGAARDQVMSAAERADVEVRCYFDPPLHRMSAFRDAARTDLEVTESLAGRMVSLPTTSDDRIEQLREAFEQQSDAGVQT